MTKKKQFKNKMTDMTELNDKENYPPLFRKNFKSTPGSTLFIFRIDSSDPASPSRSIYL